MNESELEKFTTIQDISTCTCPEFDIYLHLPYTKCTSRVGYYMYMYVNT